MSPYIKGYIIKEEVEVSTQIRTLTKYGYIPLTRQRGVPSITRIPLIIEAFHLFVFIRVFQIPRDGTKYTDMSFSWGYKSGFPRLNDFKVHK